MARATVRQHQARAPGTTANQRSTVTVYIAFARRAGFHPLRPTHYMICAFIEYLAIYIPAPATIRNKISHVREYIRMAEKPTDQAVHFRVNRALEALDRDKSYVPNKKLPVPTDLIRSVIRSIPPTPVGMGVRAAVLIMYYGALRQSEVAPPSVKKFDALRHPTRNDVKMTPSQITMKVKWAKNMQKSTQSRTVVMQAVRDKEVCAVHTLGSHFALTPTVSYSDPLLKYPGLGDPIPVSVIRNIWEAALIGPNTPQANSHYTASGWRPPPRHINGAAKRFRSSGLGAGSPQLTNVILDKTLTIMPMRLLSNLSSINLKSKHFHHPPLITHTHFMAGLALSFYYIITILSLPHSYHISLYLNFIK